MYLSEEFAGSAGKGRIDLQALHKCRRSDKFHLEQVNRVLDCMLKVLVNLAHVKSNTLLEKDTSPWELRPEVCSNHLRRIILSR